MMNLINGTGVKYFLIRGNEDYDTLLLQIALHLDPDPDPHSSQELDLDPYRYSSKRLDTNSHKMNANLKHCLQYGQLIAQIVS
jgi:hypothetical protein